MKIRNIISCLLSVTLFSTSMSAQDQNCYIKKTYPVRSGATLRISNKYGDLNFIPNKSDSIFICATIMIEQVDKELARKNIGLVTVNIDKIEDTVYVSTGFDRKFFSEIYRKGRKSFSVDILIKAPSLLNLDIINEFGNVTADEVSGIFNANISYGVLSVTKLTRGNCSPINSINVDNGKIFIEALNWMSANIRNCPSVEIGKAQALLIKSDFSKIGIKNVSSIIVDSKSDIYTISLLRNIVSESKYTSLKIKKLDGKLLSKVTYGSLEIGELQKDLKYIDITSAGAPVSIEKGNEVSFRSNIVVTNAPASFEINGQPGIIKNESNNSIIFTGIYGKDKQTESFVKIHATSGKVNIK